MRIHGSQPRARTDNTIALINVVFLMLIFFLFAGSVEPNDAHDITPPDVALEREKTDTGGALVVLPDGSMMLGGEAVTLERLAEILGADTIDSAAPLRVVADKTLPAVKLTEILAVAREAGRARIVLVARMGDGAVPDAASGSNAGLEGTDGSGAGVPGGGDE